MVNKKCLQAFLSRLTLISYFVFLGGFWSSKPLYDRHYSSAIWLPMLIGGFVVMVGSLIGVAVLSRRDGS